jgi:hypothetical protein
MVGNCHGGRRGPLVVPWRWIAGNPKGFPAPQEMRAGRGPRGAISVNRSPLIVRATSSNLPLKGAAISPSLGGGTALAFGGAVIGIGYYGPVTRSGCFKPPWER